VTQADETDEEPQYDRRVTSPPANPPSPVPVWRSTLAPEVLTTFRTIEAIAARGLPDTIRVPVQRAVAAILGVAPSGDNGVAPDERAAACVEFAEQFVVDVAGISDGQRQAMFAAMDADAFTFVQVLYVIDVFTRTRIAIDKLFSDPLVPVDLATGSETGEAADTDPAELWPTIEQFIQQVALLSALDPLTTELVRLRGARVHNCRLCQSRRSVKALDAAGSAAVFDDIAADENPALTERDRVALALTDALVTQPGSIDAALVARVHEHFSIAEITEIVFDLTRNAANKIAVALGGDAPIVSDGIEFYDIDAAGDVVADVDIDIVRGATAR